MTDNHLQQAVSALQAARDNCASQMQWLEARITELKAMMTGDMQVTTQPPVAIEKKYRRRKIAPNTGPYNLRIREIMFDGKTRSMHEVLAIFSPDRKLKDPDPIYRKVMSVLSYLTNTHYLLRVKKGVYRRNLKGVKNVTTPPANSKLSNSQLSEGILSLDGAMTAKGVKTKLELKSHTISSVKSQLDSLVAQGKMSYARGVYKRI